MPTDPTPNPVAPFLEQHGVMILDGGLATELEARGADLRDSLWSAASLIDDESRIEQVHYDYYTAGADVAITATYQASFEGFAARGLDRPATTRLLRSAVRLAGDARDRFWADADRAARLRPLVAASIGPYGAMLADGSEYRGRYAVDAKTLADFHRGRLDVLADTDVDLLACETIPSAVEVEALVTVLAEYDVPAWISCSCRDGNSVSDGTPFADAAAIATACERVVAFGVNCTDPHHVPTLLAGAAARTRTPLVAYPNSGERWDAAARRWCPGPGTTHDAWSPRRWYDAGARLIGGCCRTTPQTIADMVEVLRPPADE